MFELPPPERDGLCIPDVGEWSRDKHHFLGRYLDAFTTAMKGKNWESLHYIDLFAGAGVEQLRDTGGLDWGSPLIAAQVPHKFDRLHLCEQDAQKHTALVERLRRFPQPRAPQMLNGDANALVSRVICELPENSLSVAFLDPPGLHCHFDILRTLASRRVDLIIFFPDHLDALRNWENVYQGRPDSNLDRVLGPNANWLARLHASPRDRWADVLRDIYLGQIRTLGYTDFDHERIFAKGRPLYRLIFCSHDEAATKIWRGISRKKPDGQYTLGFD